MCGRFSQGEPSRHIADYFGAYPDDDLPDGLYNVPPTETIRIVVRRESDRRLVAARWGFRPFWRGRGADGDSREWINARAEKALDSPAFGPALRTQRCVVPADAFYEWDRSTSPRQPYAIGPVGRDGMLALAGIVSTSRDADPTVAILTTTPNPMVARVHDRMPVILERAMLDDWLHPATDPVAIAGMLVSAPEQALRMWPVSTAVNRVEADGAELLREVQTVPTLGLA